jgi:hypothetical protein
MFLFSGFAAKCLACCMVLQVNSAGEGCVLTPRPYSMLAIFICAVLINCTRSIHSICDTSIAGSL